MLTLQYARGAAEVRINAVIPATPPPTSTATAAPRPSTEGTDAIVAMATIPADGPTGTFTDRHGTTPW